MHKVRKIHGVAALALAVLLLGCASPQVDLSRSTKTLEPTDYQEVFRRWTREFRIIPVDGVENVLTARGTYLSHEFRWAYVVRMAYDLRLTPGERQELKDAQFTALDANHEFFVTVMSGVKKSDELDPEKGVWSIKLEDDSGRQVAPIAVEELRKPTVANTTYFDFDRVHRTAYKITFPIMAEDQQPILKDETSFFSLQFSSPLGQGTMRWETTK